MAGPHDEAQAASNKRPHSAVDDSEASPENGMTPAASVAGTLTIQLLVLTAYT